MAIDPDVLKRQKQLVTEEKVKRRTRAEVRAPAKHDLPRPTRPNQGYVHYATEPMTQRYVRTRCMRPIWHHRFLTVDETEVTCPKCKGPASSGETGPR